MHRADGIGQGPLGMLAAGQGGADGRPEVPQVVHGVEDAEDVHAIVHRPLDETLHHIVGIVPVAEQVLGTQQHLLTGPGHGGLEQAQALPRVFAQVADAGIEGGPTPGLQGPVADGVQLRRDGQHVLDSHARRQEGLMGVAQDDIGDPQGVERRLHARLGGRGAGLSGGGGRRPSRMAGWFHALSPEGRRWRGRLDGGRLTAGTAAGLGQLGAGIAPASSQDRAGFLPASPRPPGRFKPGSRRLRARFESGSYRFRAGFVPVPEPAVTRTASSRVNGVDGPGDNG